MFPGRKGRFKSKQLIKGQTHRGRTNFSLAFGFTAMNK
jgi:hypothetical protein